jgi:putative hydrolase of the HAD superfamily
VSRRGGPYHTIFFDVGGTLLAPRPSVGAVYAEVAARYGIRVDAEEVEREARREFRARRQRETAAGAPAYTVSLDLARQWWREIVRASFGRAAADPRFEACYQAVFEEFALPARYAIFPEVPQLLDRLAAAGHRLGIISNWDARLRPILEGLGLASRFGTIIISGEAGCEKPARRIYEIARERAGAPEGARLMLVGDSESDDVRGAEAAGFEGRLLDRARGRTLTDVLNDLMVE